jgi:hypothetical protein
MEQLRLVTASLVVALWTVMYLRAAFTAFSPPPELSGIMLCVAAYLFGSGAFRGGKRK